MRDLQSIYHDIGQALLEGLPDEWDLAWALHEVAGGGVEQCKGFCQEERGGDPREIPIGAGALPSFHELREALRAAGKPIWRAAKFTVAPGGVFELVMDYGDAAPEPARQSTSRTGY